jgi:hypothetical protein
MSCSGILIVNRIAFLFAFPQLVAFAFILLRLLVRRRPCGNHGSRLKPSASMFMATIEWRQHFLYIYESYVLLETSMKLTHHIPV